MELAMLSASRSLFHAELPMLRPVSCSSKSNSKIFPFPCSCPCPCPAQTLQFQGLIGSERRRGPFTLHASDNSANPPVPDDADVVSLRWLLVPVGDGEWRHIGYKVEMPDAFEIVSNEVIVGRLPEKADIVIPVATVSGVHARIRKKEEKLLITDLDSTNGTFVNDKRLIPGVVAAVSSGACISFGDIHLAMFQVSKLKTVTKLQQSQDT